MNKRTLNQFCNLLCIAGFHTFDSERFLKEYGDGLSAEEAVLKILALPYEEAVDVLKEYGTCRKSVEECLSSITRSLSSDLFVPEQPLPKKPSPMFPQWRGHHVKEQRRY